MAPKMKMPKIDFRSPKVRNAAIVIVCGLAGIGAWYQLVYVKRQEKIKELQTQADKKQAELNSILAMKPQLENLREEISRAQVQLDSLKSIFPDQKEIPKLIREITRLAFQAGIETQRFGPMPDVQREYYMENRYSLAIAGGYHQVAQFFSYLANLPLLINLSEVSLTSQSVTDEAQKAVQEDGQVLKTVRVAFKMTTFSSRK